MLATGTSAVFLTMVTALLIMVCVVAARVSRPARNGGAGPGGGRHRPVPIPADDPDAELLRILDDARLGDLRLSRRTFGSTDRIAAFAKATEAYAETLEEPDLAHIYSGKALGLWQAVTILGAEDETAPRRQLRWPSRRCGARFANPVCQPD